MRRCWTQEQAEYLRANYTSKSMAEIGRHVGRSAAAVCEKSRSMGLGGVGVYASRENGVFNTGDLANIFDIHTGTVHSWCLRGMPHSLVGARGLRVFKWGEVRKWILTQPEVFFPFPLLIRQKLNADFDAIPVNRSEAASRMSVCPSVLGQWKRKGCPTVKGKGGRRWYVVRDVMAWLLDNPRLGQNLSSAYVRGWRERLEAAAA